jgi:ribonuclease Z
LSFKITILGSSGAVPAFGRFPSSQLVEIQNEFMLVDCGEGAQIQLLKFNGNLQRINHIFISHLHGDHYLGLMGLLFSMHLNHRTKELHLYSHRGLQDIIITQLKYSNSALRFRLLFHELTPGIQEVILDNKHFTVETIPLKHKLDCSGFLFREKIKPRRIDKDKIPADISLAQLAALKTGSDIIDDLGKIKYKNELLTLPPRKSRSYAYCSDTIYDIDLINIVRQVDVLYHEATFMTQDEDKASETKHSTAAQAARIAKEAQVGKLIIGHFSARYKELDLLWQEARSILATTELALEGTTFEIHE